MTVDEYGRSLYTLEEIPEGQWFTSKWWLMRPCRLVKQCPKIAKVQRLDYYLVEKPKLEYWWKFNTETPRYILMGRCKKKALRIWRERK